MGRPLSFRLTGVLCLLCGVAFLCVLAYFSTLPCQALDTVLTISGAREVVECYGDAGRQQHQWGTRHLDAVFPFLLGATLLIGLLRYAGRLRIVMTLLVLVYVLADQIENKAILGLLALDFEWVATKVWATWIKYLTVAAPLFLVIKGLLDEARQRAASADKD